jgi:hypothetical protein
MATERWFFILCETPYGIDDRIVLRYNSLYRRIFDKNLEHSLQGPIDGDIETLADQH